MSVPQQIDHALKRYGDNVFAVCDGREATLKAVADSGQRLASSLARMGVGPGERVAVLLENSIACLEIDFGLARGGYVRVSLNPRSTVRDASYIFEDAQPAVLIYGSSFYALVATLRSKDDAIRHYIEVADGSSGDSVIGVTHDFDALANGPITAEALPVIAEEDDYCICYTSGSSGKPKGVVLSHRAMLTVAQNVLTAFGPETSDERVLLLQPLSHGSAFFILPYAIKGACVVLMRKFSPDAVLRMIPDKRITSMKLVPTMLHRLLESPLLDSTDLSGLRKVIYGGSHISSSTLRRAVSIFASRLMQHYGQSEAPSILTVLTGREHCIENVGRPVLESAGRPIAGVELKIVGPSRQALSIGEIGEVAVRAPHVMSRYWRRPQLTECALIDGWLYTNDLGRIDEDGYLYLLGRKDELIISGGFNIAPKEVEDAICMHPAVFEAAVVGAADEKWGQIVVAYVSVRDPTLSTLQILDFVKPMLGFKTPKVVKIIAELPKNPNGKIDKRSVALLN